MCQSSLAKALPWFQGCGWCRDKMPALANFRYWSILETHGSFDDWLWRRNCAGGRSGRASGKQLLHAGPCWSIPDCICSSSAHWLQQLKSHAVSSVNLDQVWISLVQFFHDSILTVYSVKLNTDLRFRQTSRSMQETAYHFKNWIKTVMQSSFRWICTS